MYFPVFGKKDTFQNISAGSPLLPLTVLTTKYKTALGIINYKKISILKIIRAKYYLCIDNLFSGFFLLELQSKAVFDSKTINKLVESKRTCICEVVIFT